MRGGWADMEMLRFSGAGDDTRGPLFIGNRTQREQTFSEPADLC
jgi:hypothetical protein